MSGRTRAAALALVNWKGVFYERLLLDRHVTALEGANGAGKTTVMIAAYIVLLPDMSRLRFRNVGEADATGGDKGVWGRLGDPGRPSYAAIDFVLAGATRLVAGVHLERKSEPSVEPTPFIVSGLAPEVRLQDLLLIEQGNSDVVPELPELRENAARLGGRLQVFASARDYFAALFEQGVMPLRLGTDEERNKLNEMLRTSMTGGISRALTSELRGFLLKEEGGLADTLQRMRGNLDACRRTRTEVQESRRLEREIGGVFEAGQAMFAAAVLATRERAAEYARRLADAETAQRLALEAHAEAEDALARTQAELDAGQARGEELARRLAAARSWLERVRDALEAAGALERCGIALEAANAEASRCAEVRAGTELVRERRREELRRAQADYRRAAAGLADLQRGIEELHRRAGAYHQVSRRLREAEAALRAAIAVPELDERIVASRAELAEIDRERRSATVQLDDAADHRRRHADVLAALRLLAGALETHARAPSRKAAASAGGSGDHDAEERELPGSGGALADAYRIATEVLRRYRDRVALAERGPALARELGEARRRADQQESARSRAAQLGVVVAAAGAGEVVRTMLEEAEAARARLDEAARSARSDRAAAERRVHELQRRRGELTAREPEWREHSARAFRIGERVGAPVVDRASLDRARAALADQLARARELGEATRAAEERLASEARELASGGGALEPELLRLRDLLGADLVAESFEDVGLDHAGALEARLGPLARALVVDAPRAAVSAVRQRPAVLGDVWLVPRDSNLEALATAATTRDAGDPDVVVEEGVALRVSRIPERPRLGRRARQARAAELRAEADAKARALEQLRAEIRLLERLVLDGEALLAGHAIWLAGDPASELGEVRRRLAESKAQIETLRAAATRHADAARELHPRIEGLRALLADAFLLDPPDHGEQAGMLEAAHRSALDARDAVARAAPHAAVVDEHVAVLRTTPLSEDDLARLRLRVEQLRHERERLHDALDALEYVRDHAEALIWSDAPGRLADNQALVPAIEAQLADAVQAQEDADEAARDADAQHDAATTRWHDASAKQMLASEQHEAAARRFAALEIPAPSADAEQAAAEDVERIEREQQAHAARREALLTARGEQQRICHEARVSAEQAGEKLAIERREAEPSIARWDELRERAMQRGLLGAGFEAAQTGFADVRGHVNLVQEARLGRERLFERLRGAHGGAGLLVELEVLRDGSDAAFADAFLQLWLAVRDWLHRRLPAHVAQVDDPREALMRLRDQLASLEERLARQEHDLRGASEDVARGIDVQVRKARGQVQRLNKNLDGVSFGSIHGIRVRLEPVERMEQVLRALREGEAQGLLFQGELPFEEALEEIFRRFGGGRAGGHRLLDYREYVHLHVEIRRKVGTAWESANPTRLSTGEAIGVGAALMMVVLTEWERDAVLLRGKRALGSLRFLFLDEANRLSHDNLGVLFELCRTLDLQLLIASPEVARAEGNTTYRLVRRTTPEGREQVVISGRRTRASA